MEGFGGGVGGVGWEDLMAGIHIEWRRCGATLLQLLSNKGPTALKSKSHQTPIDWDAGRADIGRCHAVLTCSTAAPCLHMKVVIAR